MNSASSSHQITQLLLTWRSGNKAALDELMPLVYDELRRLARHYMRGQKVGHSLQATALVNEAYLRLIDSNQVEWQDRSHFFAVSAQLMRRVLVDFARKRNSLKRGGDQIQVTVDDDIEEPFGNQLNFIDLDEALKNLETFDERQSKIIELRYFAGLTETEIAETLGISVRTVRRDWRLARAWLYRKLKKNDS